VNTSDTRRSHGVSEVIRRQFWLPADMLNAIYEAPVVKRFYSAAGRVLRPARAGVLRVI
jgi:hypothetical protein